jgi:hypothetical protein
VLEQGAAGTDNPTIVIAGAATKGPIRSANVAVYAMNEFGFTQGGLATTITVPSLFHHCSITVPSDQNNAWLDL